MAIELVVADMAGTTVRDDGLVEDAFVAALASAGIDRASAEYEDKLAVVRTAMGRPKGEVFAELLGSRDQGARANAAFEQTIGDEIRRGRVRPVPGAEDVLRHLREQGLRICLATGFSPQTQGELLTSLGWHGLVDLVLAPGAGIRGRPHPDLVLVALMRLGLDDVRHVAVVGDTVNDLRCGWGAGASIVAGVLTGAHGRSELETAPHTHILDSIVGLPEVVDEV